MDRGNPLMGWLSMLGFFTMMGFLPVVGLLNPLVTSIPLETLMPGEGGAFDVVEMSYPISGLIQLEDSIPSFAADCHP